MIGINLYEYLIVDFEFEFVCMKWMYEMKWMDGCWRVNDEMKENEYLLKGKKRREI